MVRMRSPVRSRLRAPAFFLLLFCGPLVKWLNTPVFHAGIQGFESPTGHQLFFCPAASSGVFAGDSPSGKATDFDSVIPRFESWIPSHLHEPLAQLEEHLTFNQGVVGSSPTWLTICPCAYGGIGRRTGFRFQRATVGVQVPLRAPFASKFVCADRAAMLANGSEIPFAFRPETCYITSCRLS